ncbi:uncharacterized protein LOC141917226 [Strix aluco]|uniref:uncharacterized protein LOC141917226 n=1 Tax=Strix aluco TaxID=111821 RepID=UPI003DA2692A
MAPPGGRAGSCSPGPALRSVLRGGAAALAAASRGEMRSRSPAFAGATGEGTEPLRRGGVCAPGGGGPGSFTPPLRQVPFRWGRAGPGQPRELPRAGGGEEGQEAGAPPGAVAGRLRNSPELPRSRLCLSRSPGPPQALWRGQQAGPRCVCRSPGGRGGSGRGRSPAITVSAASFPLAEAALVRSCPGDAVDCARLGLAWGVSAWPCTSHGTGTKRDRRRLVAAASGQELPWLELERPEKGKEGENQGHLGSTRLPLQTREPASLGEEGALLTRRSRPDRQRAPRGCCVTPGAVCVTPRAVRPRSARASEAVCVGNRVLQELRDARGCFQGEDGQATGAMEEEGRRRRTKGLKWQMSLAALRATAAIKRIQYVETARST